MAKIVIECANPNDFTEIVAAAEKAAGSCTTTYAKQHLGMMEAGTSNGQRESSRIIAADSGETPEAVRDKIKRGLKDVGDSHPQNSQPAETITNPVTPQASSVFLQDRHPQGGGAREGAGRPVSDSSIEEFLIKAKKLAKLAYKARSAPSFELRKKELTAATHLITIVITETREDVKWV